MIAIQLADEVIGLGNYSILVVFDSLWQPLTSGGPDSAVLGSPFLHRQFH